MKEILRFLSDLKVNNNREWFDQNRSRYQRAKTDFESFIELRIAELANLDPSIGLPPAKDSIFRIFRDVRFSPDKQPYKTNFGAFISSGGRKSPKAGYYIHLEPGASMVGGGIYMPQPEILKKIRQEIYFDAGGFKLLVQNKEFMKFYGELSDFDKLKRPPRDYDASFQDIDLLMYKSYVVMHKLPDAMVESDRLPAEIYRACELLKPLNHFLNRAFEEV